MQTSVPKAMWFMVTMLCASAAAQTGVRHPQRNVIIFVADGLRYGSVNERDTPALYSVRKRGVDFQNGHSLFPTFTTANASAIATGHALGDTGDYSNTIYVGYKQFASPPFARVNGSVTPFLENDVVLSDLAARFDGNYLGEPTLLTSAREAGYAVASVGKLGPTAIQQVEAVASGPAGIPSTPGAIILDDATGSPAGVPLAADVAAAIKSAGLAPEAPSRSNGYGERSPYNNGYAGNAKTPGTLLSNYVQAQWFTDVTTRVLLPRFSAQPKGFVLLFWSREPDGTQHNHGDSFQTLNPGINGPSVQHALQTADHCLQQILDWLDSHPAIKANTDLFITSDHGFATLSRRELSLTEKSKAPSTQLQYIGRDASAPADDRGTLPTGFLAVDLALGLHTHLFDPLRVNKAGTSTPYMEVALDRNGASQPLSGSGILAEKFSKTDGSDAEAIVAANGGSDLIYVPTASADTVKKIAKVLTQLDYVGGIFVDDQFGAVPGALPLSKIFLVGSSRLPRPAIVVAFKVFYRQPGNLQTAVQISDTSLEEGQGMHGGFGRESTFNNMAAMGPDFKRAFVDVYPASNADIVPTLASILGLDMASHGPLKGRVLRETMTGAPSPAPSKRETESSTPADNGFRTVIEYQDFAGHRYNDRACFVASASASAGCP